MKKYLYILILLVFIYSPNVYALNGVCMIDSEYSNIEQGDEITINFYIHDINNLEINGGYLELKYDNDVFDYMGIQNIYDGFDINVSDNKGKLSVKLKSDNYINNINDAVNMVSIIFKVKDDVSNGYSKIIMVGENTSYITDTNGNNNSCLSTGNKSLDYNIYNDSNDAFLSDLSINNVNLKPKFNSNINNYNAVVSSNVNVVNINGTCKVDGCVIEGIGKKNLSVGKNNFKIVVTSPNGKIVNTYNINVEREKSNDIEPIEEKKEDKKKLEVVKDNNSLLKILSVSEGELDPIFVPEKNEYSVEVDSDVKKIRINAICSGIECTVKGTGNKYLEYGKNEYEIEVIAEDGSNNIYKIEVFRKYDLRLTSLIVKNHSLSPRFDKDILNYKVTVGSDVDKLDINTETSDPNVKIQIKGNDNFTEGKNVVKIEMSYDEGSKKTYTIIVNKEKNDVDKVDNSKSIWDNTYVIIGGIIGGIILFGLIVGTVWYLLHKKSENN